MKKIMDWMQNSFAPKMEKISNNTWISAVQAALMTSMPMVLIGSFVVLLSSLNEIFAWFPDLSLLNSFSMGLLSLYIAFLVPYYALEKNSSGKIKLEAGLAGTAFYLIMLRPVFMEDGNMCINASLLGNGGMLVALVSGLLVGMIMNFFAKHSFFKEDTALPDFITIWFDTLIPILLVLFIGWFLAYQLNFDMAAMITQLFSPILMAGDSFAGFVFLYFIGAAFFYSFGISAWVLYPIEYTITMQGLATNQAAVAAGLAPTALNAYGVSYYWLIGGGGCTLALALMMTFLAKSKKCKVIGKATIVPSIANINEPLVFGAPMAFNPILMVPMWLIGLIAPALTWLALNFGLIPKITEIFAFWYLPFPITTWFVGGFRGLLFSLFIFVLSALVYYPFFKIYDKQCLKEEEKDN